MTTVFDAGRSIGALGPVTEGRILNSPTPEGLVLPLAQEGKIVSISNEMPARLQEVRDVLLREIPQNYDQLNIDRVTAFFAQLGLQRSDFIVFDPATRPRIAELLHRLDDVMPYAFGERPFYLRPLQLAFIERHAETEARSTAIYTESMLVHELGHGSANNVLYMTYENGKLDCPINGFAIGDLGRFFEEGFSSLLQRLYLRENPDNQMLARVAADFEGMSGKPLDIVLPVTPLDGGVPYQMPLEYLYVDQKGELNHDDHVLAGVGLELCISRDQTLLTTMIEARTDPSKRDFVWAKLGALSPDLCHQLFHLRYSYLDFVRGLNLIVDTLYGGKFPTDKEFWLQPL